MSQGDNYVPKAPMGAVSPPAAARRHILTVAVEDYYQVGSFNRAVQRGQWHRFESRVVRNTKRTLDLLDEHGVHATFFVLGWIADEFPELVREIADRGHEVASKGYWHRSIREMTPEEFREDLRRSREALEQASGRRVMGYRVAHDWLQPEDLWALDVLAEEGFHYDSSICPMFETWSRDSRRRFIHEHRAGDRKVVEVPLSTKTILGFSVPVAGGNYFRQFPHRMMRWAFRHWCKVRSDPFVMYFQIWELDAEQPRISATSFLTRVRHYRNLDKMVWVLREYFNEAKFGSIAEHLGLELPSVVPAATDAPVDRADRARQRLRVMGRPSGAKGPAVESLVGGTRGALQLAPLPAAAPKIPVTLVVPCYNEELVLPYLSNTLEEVEAEFSELYELHYVFVDDQSQDGTYGALERIFGGRPRTRLVRHSVNMGVAQAILTGIRASSTEVVCSIDCDCTYDPRQIGVMIPKLTEGVDLVTASPYHPEGRVVNVPEWRLVFSRTLSRIYRFVFRTQLATYTSCFRVYRRSVVSDLPVRERGFLGIAEMLGVLDFQGRTIVECPAVLEVRMLGRSKMKLLRTILGHLKLIAHFVTLRLRSPRGSADVISKPPGRTIPGDPVPLSLNDPSIVKGKPHG